MKPKYVRIEATIYTINYSEDGRETGLTLYNRYPSIGAAKKWSKEHCHKKNPGSLVVRLSAHEKTRRDRVANWARECAKALQVRIRAARQHYPQRRRPKFGGQNPALGQHRLPIRPQVVTPDISISYSPRHKLPPMSTRAGKGSRRGRGGA